MRLDPTTGGPNSIRLASALARLMGCGTRSCNRHDAVLTWRPEAFARGSDQAESEFTRVRLADASDAPGAHAPLRPHRRRAAAPVQPRRFRRSPALQRYARRGPAVAIVDAGVRGTSDNLIGEPATLIAPRVGNSLSSSIPLRASFGIGCQFFDRANRRRGHTRRDERRDELVAAFGARPSRDRAIDLFDVGKPRRVILEARIVNQFLAPHQLGQRCANAVR